MASDNLIDFVSQYEAILWDYDGTIITSEDIHARIGTQILQNNGLPEITFNTRFSMMGLGEFGIHEELTRQGYNILITPEEFKSQQSNLFMRYIDSVDNPNDILRRGVMDIINASIVARVDTFVVSNSAKDSVLSGLIKCRLVDIEKPEQSIIHTSHIITHDDIIACGLHGKPAPDGFLHAKALSTRTKTGRFLAIEDSLTGLQAAINADCDVLQIFYDSIGQNPDPRTTYAVPDSDSLTNFFRLSASEPTNKPNDIHRAAITGQQNPENLEIRPTLDF